MLDVEIGEVMTGNRSGDDELIQVTANDNDDSGHASDEELIGVSLRDNEVVINSPSRTSTSCSNPRDIVSLIILLLVNLLNYMDRFSVAGLLYFLLF